MSEVAERPAKVKRPPRRRAQQPLFFITSNRDEARANLDAAYQFCVNAWEAGKRVTWELKEEEDHVFDWRRRFYHGHVLAVIAAQARVGEKQERFPMPVWKEYFREKYLGYKWETHLNPYTGKKHRRKMRVSTEDISDREYAALVEQVIAEASTDLGVEFEFMTYEEYRNSMR